MFASMDTRFRSTPKSISLSKSNDVIRCCIPWDIHFLVPFIETISGHKSGTSRVLSKCPRYDLFLCFRRFIIFIMSMLSFDYQNPTRIIFGEGQIAQLPNYIPNDNTVLMCYGHGSIKKNGVYDQVMNALKGYEVTEFSGIEPNPDFDTLIKAIAILKENGCWRWFRLGELQVHCNGGFP